MAGLFWIFMFIKEHRLSCILSWSQIYFCFPSSRHSKILHRHRFVCWNTTEKIPFHKVRFPWVSYTRAPATWKDTWGRKKAPFLPFLLLALLHTTLQRKQPRRRRCSEEISFRRAARQSYLNWLSKYLYTVWQKLGCNWMPFDCYDDLCTCVCMCETDASSAPVATDLSKMIY